MTFTPSDSGSTAGRDAAAEPAPKDRRNVLQSALSAIEKLQARIEATEEARHEPIAIVGRRCARPAASKTPQATGAC